ncbi:MAG: site-specific integrase [Pseudomonadales bacterium]|jgi:integrase
MKDIFRFISSHHKFHSCDSGSSVDNELARLSLLIAEAFDIDYATSVSWLNKFIAVENLSSSIQIATEPRLIRPYRPSVIPNTLRAYDLDMVDAIARQLRRMERQTISSSELALTWLYFDLVNLNLIESRIAIETILILISQRPRIASNFVVIETPNGAASLLVGKNYRRCIKKIGQCVNSVKAVNSRINSGLRYLLCSMGLVSDISPSRLASAIKANTLVQGGMPFLCAAMSTSPLPLCHSHDFLSLTGPSLEDIRPILFVRPLPPTGRRRTTISKPKENTEQPELGEKSPLQHHREGLALLTCKRIFKIIESRFKRKVKAQSSEIAEAAIRDTFKQLEECMPRSSAIVALTSWLLNEVLKKGKINAKTATVYLDELTRGTILRSHNAGTLTTWSECDFDEYLADLFAKNSKRLDVAKIIRRALRFFDFLRKNGFPTVPVYQLNASGKAIKFSRNVIVSPAHIDDMRYALSHVSSPSFQAASVAISLAFYGGLRSAEIANLKLPNVTIFGDNLYVDVTAGKTPSARRRILLHIHAPKYVLNELAQYKHQRVSEIGNHRAAYSSYFLSDLDSMRDEVIQIANHNLKLAYGKNVTLHTLRHSFASHFIVRYYAMTNPIVLEDMYSRGHPLFGDELHQRFIEEFSSLGSNTQSLLEVFRQLGHSSTSTLFNTYAHSLHIILRAEAIRLGKLEELTSSR